jgi:hypothetical protein
VYEHNHTTLDIMAVGHITSRLKHKAVPITIIHEKSRMEIQKERKYQENSTK